VFCIYLFLLKDISGARDVVRVWAAGSETILNHPQDVASGKAGVPSGKGSVAFWERVSRQAIEKVRVI
jgi:hypothetical protein